MNQQQFKKHHLNTVKGWKAGQWKSQKWYLDWHVKYGHMLRKVEKVRNQLTPQGTSLSLKNVVSNDFLKDLLFEESYKKNGIATAGKGRLTKKQFDEFIKDDDVLDSIEAVIKNPSASTSQQLRKAIQNCNERENLIRWDGDPAHNNWLITNRVVAACTDRVSSTVSREKFSLIFDWFIANKIISEYPKKRSIFILNGKDSDWKDGKEMDEREWYDENCILISELEKLFKNEISNGETDLQFISIDVWDKWYLNFQEEWNKYDSK